LKSANFQILKTVQGQDEDRFGQDQTSKNGLKSSKNGLKSGLKTKTGLKDYITGFLPKFAQIGLTFAQTC